MKPALLAVAAIAFCAPAVALAQSKTKTMAPLPIAVPVAPVPPAGPPPTRHGNFRFTVTGFDVAEQTWDDAMQRDGKDDEVFIVTETRVLTPPGGGRPSFTVDNQRRTRVMGDTNGFEARIRAGKASMDGGLRTGDSMPARDANYVRTTPSMNSLPLLVWEGDLADDGAVMIVPTIWEWDGFQPLEGFVHALLSPIDTLGSSFDVAHTDTSRGPNDWLRGYVEGSITRLSQVQLGRDVVGEHEVQEASVVGSGGDRPIGMEFVNGRYRFNPWVITMNYGEALYTATHNNAGAGMGVIKLPYVDGPALRGNYTLYLLVEQLP